MSYISDFKSAPFDIFSQFAGTGTGAAGGTNTPDSSFNSLCGTRFKVEGDGREVTLVSIGTTAITTGKVVASSAQVTAFQKLAMTVPTTAPATAGTFLVSVTNGTTVLNQNQFAGGYFVTASGTGLGQTLKIASHTGGSNAGQVVVTLEDPIQVTLDATTTVSFVANPYQNIITNPAAHTGIPVGVTLYALSASVAGTFSGTTGVPSILPIPQYGLIVTKGMVGALIDTLTNVGYPVGPSASVAGAIAVATLTTVPQIGISAQTQTDTQYGMVYINL